MVLEWSRIDLLCCSVSLHFKGTWETQNHHWGILCESCACIIHTNVQSCMSIISETLHDNLSLTSEESLTDSKLPDTGYLRTKGQESVYETCACACVIHTILLSYSHFTLMFARGTCASWSSSSVFKQAHGDQNTNLRVITIMYSNIGAGVTSGLGRNVFWHGI